MFKQVLGITLVLLAAPALAGDLSYSYVGGSYQTIEIDNDFGPNPDGDGLAVEFSFDIAANWYLVGEYGKGDLDFGIDLDTTSFGAGYHAPISDRADVFANLTYESWDLGFADDDGFGVAVGVRGYLADRVEMTGRVNYVDIGDFDDTSFGVTGLYEFTDAFAAGLAIDSGDVTTFGVTARFYFAR